MGIAAFPLPARPSGYGFWKGKEILETTSDSRGQFTFANLDPGVYEVELEQAPAVSRPADLTRAWCATVTLPIRR